MSLEYPDKWINTIYIITNQCYNLVEYCNDCEYIVKIGSTKYLPARYNNYITYNPKKTNILAFYQILEYNCYRLDNDIKKYFNDYRIKDSGGTEYYKSLVIDKLEDYFNDNNIKFIKYDDISDFPVITNENRKALQKALQKELINELRKDEDNYLEFINILEEEREQEQLKLEEIKPFPHQQDVLKNIIEFYRRNHIGQILWACGLGKAKLGLFIVKALLCKIVLIGVPSIYLQNQMVKEIICIFPNIDYKCNILCVGGNDKTSTTNIIKIQNFLETNKNNLNKNNFPKFVITTYDSCHILTKLDNKYNFDIKIGDECHHLVCIDNDTTSLKSYIRFHDIHSSKTLFMTATAKNIQNNFAIQLTSNENPQSQYNKSKQDNENVINENVIYNMNDETIFGKVIDTKSIKWAIENNKITDYKVLVLYNTITEIHEILKIYKLHIKHMELFVSAYMTLKSIEKYSDLTHILIYTNTQQNSDIIYSYINLILDKRLVRIDKDKLYLKSLHSNSGCGIKLDKEVIKFKNARYGIISCVYIFGEGFDLPKLNGVCFAENMISPIRTTQCAMRPNRLDKENQNKIAYIIIPYLDNEEYGICNKSFQKCFNILDKLRNHDDIIEHKIKVANICLDVLDISNTSANCEANVDCCNANITCVSALVNNDSKSILADKKYLMLDIKENDLELEKLKLRLKYSRALRSKQTPEKDEYDYVKLLNRQLKHTSKGDYFSCVFKDKHRHWIPEPDIYFKGYHVWVSWYDFLGIDTSGYCKNKDEWRRFCMNVGIKSLEDYKEKSKIYKELPEMPEDIYINFSNITYELGINAKRR